MNVIFNTIYYFSIYPPFPGNFLNLFIMWKLPKFKLFLRNSKTSCKEKNIDDPIRPNIYEFFMKKRCCFQNEGLCGLSILFNLFVYTKGKRFFRNFLLRRTHWMQSNNLKIQVFQKAAILFVYVLKHLKFFGYLNDIRSFRTQKAINTTLTSMVLNYLFMSPPSYYKLLDGY